MSGDRVPVTGGGRFGDASRGRWRAFVGSLRGRVGAGDGRRRLSAVRNPVPGCGMLRVVMSLSVAAIGVVTLAGATVSLMVWRDADGSGPTSERVDRAWSLLDSLRGLERWFVVVAVGTAVVWSALAAGNVRRATGNRHSVVATAVSVPVAVWGLWETGSRTEGLGSQWLDGRAGELAGVGLQALWLVVPWLGVEMMSRAVGAVRGPVRLAVVLGLALLVDMRLFSGVSTVEPDVVGWGRLGTELVVAGSVLLVAALAVNEVAWTIEESTRDRAGLRFRFRDEAIAHVLV